MTYQVRETETVQPFAGVLPERQNASLDKARIALIHYWFVNRRGGERVVEAMAELMPQADIFSLVVDPEVLPASLQNRSITTSFLQHVPGSRRWHRRWLPLYPLALEQFDFTNYDLVLSSESGPAKGILTSSRTCHVCYCHSPMRYLWDFYHQYRNGNSFGPLSRPLFTLAAHYLRMWDAAAAARVDYFVANSRNVAARVRKHYRRDSTVIYPPVNITAGYLPDRNGDYYLVVGQLVDYKRVDLAIAACNQLARPLRIVGEGEQYQRLRKLAGATVSFLGPLCDADLREQYAHCRALLFPGEEDFGIVPVEALSFGRPVIAFGRGGVTETVNGAYPGISIQKRVHTGVFFKEQNIASLVEAIRAFEAAETEFSPPFIRSRAERFDETHFKERLREYLSEKLSEFQNQALET
jgi:glycosyltransferase involved in cell wall biosynthesis